MSSQRGGMVVARHRQCDAACEMDRPKGPHRNAGTHPMCVDGDAVKLLQHVLPNVARRR